MRSSLDQAMAFAVCGHYPSISNKSPISQGPISDQWLENKSFYEIANPQNLVKAEYCAEKNFRTFINNENSLMWTYVGFLKAFPDIGLRGMNFGIHAIHVCMILTFIVFLYFCNFNSIILVMLAVALARLNSLVYETHTISYYSFLMPSVLALVGALGLFLKFRWFLSFKRGAPLAFILGLFLAYLFHLRSSYVPVYLSVAMVFLILSFSSQIKNKLMILRSLCLILFIPFGYVTFNKVAMASLKTVKNDYNYTYHTVMHPLVLGLATPPNELSERLGITWDDSVGARLAKTVDPNAEYLNPSYEKALLVYYIKLWTYHFRDMLKVYQLKKNFTRQSQTKLERPTWQEILQFPSILMIQKLGFYIFCTLILVALRLLRKRLDVEHLFLYSSFTISGLLLWTEAVIIFPVYNVIYHTFISAFLLVLGVFFWHQLIIYTIRWTQGIATYLKIQNPRTVTQND